MRETRHFMYGIIMGGMDTHKQKVLLRGMGTKL